MGNMAVLLKFIKVHKWLVLASALLGSCTVLCSAGLLGASAVLISKAALTTGMLELMTLVALVRFFGIFRAVFRYSERLASHDVTFKVLSKLRIWYYQKLLPLMPAAVGNRSAEMFKNILSDIELIQFFYLRVVASPLICVFTVSILALFLAIFVPKAAVILLLAFVAEGILLPILFGKIQKRYAKDEQFARDRFYQAANDFLLGFDSIWFYGVKKSAVAKSSCTTMQKEERKRKNADIFLEMCNSLVAIFVLVGCFYVASVAVNTGQLQGIYLVMVPLVAYSALEAVKPMPLAVRFYYASSLAMEDLLAVCKEEAQGRDKEQEGTVWANNEILFDQVSFSYGKEKVLDGLSFHIKSGEKVALIGEIGSGKSSIINLILGFYKQNGGYISLGGIDINRLSTKEIGKHIAYLSQENAIFCGSVRDNLSLVAECSEEEMTEALKQAQLWDYVNHLPKGLDYVLEEGGRNLSGGQRKRLALAQIFLQNKPIVILDEPLEGLDKENREIIFRNLKEYAKDKTLIYISHNEDEIQRFEHKIKIKKVRNM